MREVLEEVLLLQTDWNARNTEAMDRRGQLIRHDACEWLRDRAAELAAAAGIAYEDFGVEGRDGTGMKTEVPWARFHSRVRSPRATAGWYVVYLFDALGDRVYISLNQGTTNWTGSDFAARPPDELLSRVRWARAILADEARSDLVFDISLASRRSKLGEGYATGNVCALVYELDTIPSESVLEQDAVFMASLLGRIYRAASATPPPGENPEVAELVDIAEKSAGRVARATGQGFRLTSAERDVIELHAMEVAGAHFRDLGWTVRDVSGSNESFDLHLTRDGVELRVEVKGTTSPGTQVVLTRNEVVRQREYFPANALAIVRNIHFDRSTKPPEVSGGELKTISPWAIDDADLRVVAYIYETGLR